EQRPFSRRGRRAAHATRTARRLSFVGLAVRARVFRASRATAARPRGSTGVRPDAGSHAASAGLTAPARTRAASTRSTRARAAAAARADAGSTGVHSAATRIPGRTAVGRGGGVALRAGVDARIGPSRVYAERREETLPVTLRPFVLCLDRRAGHDAG